MAALWGLGELPHDCLGIVASCVCCMGLFVLLSKAPKPPDQADFDIFTGFTAERCSMHFLCMLQQSLSKQLQRISAVTKCRS